MDLCAKTDNHSIQKPCKIQGEFLPLHPDNPNSTLWRTHTAFSNCNTVPSLGGDTVINLAKPVSRKRGCYHLPKQPNRRVLKKSPTSLEANLASSSIKYFTNGRKNQKPRIFEPKKGAEKEFIHFFGGLWGVNGRQHFRLGLERSSPFVFLFLRPNLWVWLQQIHSTLARSHNLHVNLEEIVSI